MSNEEQIMSGINALQSEITRIGNRVHQLKATNFEGKNVLLLSETAEYTGFSEDYIYRHRAEIGYSKPNSKNLFFEKIKVDVWLLRGAAKSQDEIDREVNRNVLGMEKPRHAKGYIVSEKGITTKK
jgi:hypothetical protein